MQNFKKKWSRRPTPQNSLIKHWNWKTLTPLSDEDKIGLITLKYEKDIQKKTDNLIALYKDQSEKELDVIRFENTDL